MTESGPSKHATVRQSITVQQRLEALFVGALIGALSLLPVSAVPKVGAAFGWLLFNVFGLARKTALRNLDIAFGHLSRADRLTIARAVHQAKTMTMFCVERALCSEPKRQQWNKRRQKRGLVVRRAGIFLDGLVQSWYTQRIG